jgi:hypothetical protein
VLEVATSVRSSSLCVPMMSSFFHVDFDALCECAKIIAPAAAAIHIPLQAVLANFLTDWVVMAGPNCSVTAIQ